MTYRSPYEAYPFLSDPADDLRCDYEILTDQMASMMGMLAALAPEFREDLLAQEALLYQANAGARTFCSLTEAEIADLAALCARWRAQTEGRCRRFVLPQGSQRASLAHVLRAKSKEAVRMLYRMTEQGVRIDPRLIDALSLLSEFFFRLALKLNALDGVEEIEFESRNYPAPR